MLNHLECNGRRGAMLVDSLLCLCAIAILASLMIPAWGVVKDSVRSLACQSNLRQIGMSVSSYSQDWRGQLPPVNIYQPGFGWVKWPQQILPYLSDEHRVHLGALGRSVIKGCPSFILDQKSNDTDLLSWDHSSYGMNQQLLKPMSNATSNWTRRDTTIFHVRQLTHLATRLLAGDAIEYYFNPTVTGDYRHRGSRVNAVYCDGRTSSLDQAEAGMTVYDPAAMGR